MTYKDALAGRVSLPGLVYHITICTNQRRPVFANWQAGRILVHTLKSLQDQQIAHSLAWVIMPDHLHWLMQLGEKHTLPSAIRLCKGRSSRAVNLHLARQGRLWQKGLNETIIRDDISLRQVARYIVSNPLRASLVSKLGDYPLWDAVWL